MKSVVWTSRFPNHSTTLTSGHWELKLLIGGLFLSEWIAFLSSLHLLTMDLSRISRNGARRCNCYLAERVWLVSARPHWRLSTKSGYWTILQTLNQPYVPVEGEVDVDHDVEDFQRQVDQLAKALAATSPTAQCDSAEVEGTFAIRLLASKALKNAKTHGVRVRARPVSLPSSQFYPVDLSETCWVEFAPVSLLGLTSFFVFEVESVDLKIRRQFVLNISLTGEPENRHEAILRDLLSDRDRVLRFMLLLLLDTGARDLGKLIDTEGDGENTFSFVHSLFGATLFESLVRALDRDPERLEHVAQVIVDLQQTNEGKKLLPEDLDAIWEPIWAVRARQIERKKQRQENAK